MKIAFACIGTVATLAACSSVVTVNGKQVLEDQWARDVSTVRSRAPIDLGCAPEKITVEPLDNFGGQMRYASQVVATGCEKTAIYTRIDVRAGLMLNSVRPK